METSHKNYFLQKFLKLGDSKLRLCRVFKYLDSGRAIFTYTQKINHERLEQNNAYNSLKNENVTSITSEVYCTNNQPSNYLVVNLTYNQ